MESLKHPAWYFMAYTVCMLLVTFIATIVIVVIGA